MRFRCSRIGLMRFTSFLRSETGATALEYGLIASLISVVAIAAIGNVGSITANNVFGTISNTLR